MLQRELRDPFAAGIGLRGLIEEREQHQAKQAVGQVVGGEIRRARP